MHPRFELPPAADLSKEMPKRPPVCHNCGELGHKASFCPKLPPEQREAQMKADEMKYRQIALMKQQNPQYNHHLQQKIQGQLREQQETRGSRLLQVRLQGTLRESLLLVPQQQLQEFLMFCALRAVDLYFLLRQTIKKMKTKT
jgi:hypothetical protein